MKIKIIFTSPPYTEETNPQPHDANEKVVFIKDPYTITSIDGGRRIEAEDQSTVTYEEYCANLKTIINETIRAQKLDEVHPCEAISIEGWKEPPNFDALHKALAKAHIPFSSPCEMTIINGSYGGDLYVNATRHLVKSAQSKDHQVFFNITLAKKIPGEETLLAVDDDDLILTEHDKAKLAVSRNIAFFPSPDSPAVMRHFTDDQLVGRQVKSTRTTQDDGYRSFKGPISQFLKI